MVQHASPSPADQPLQADDRGARRAAAFWLLLVGLCLGTELYFHLRLPDWPYYRGWSVAHQDSGPFASADAPGPFFPHVVYEGSCYGDLAFLTNLPELREVRPQRFVTDGYGYRNAPGRENGPWAVVALGDSVMAGAGSSDEDVFCAQLEKRLAAPVYNAGGKSAPLVLVESRWVEHPPRVMILECIERVLFVDEAMQQLARVVPGSEPLAAPAAGAQPHARPGRWSATYSAATHLAERGNAALKWSVFGELGNPECILGVDGKTLFYLDEMAHATPAPAQIGIERIADALQAAQAALASHGIQLVFLLSPDKATVYRELVPARFRDAIRPAGEFVDAMQGLLDERGIPYVDVLGAFEEARAEDPELQLYWTDDTHWNPRGAALAAAAAAERLSRL